MLKDSLAARFWGKVNKNGPVVRPELGPCWPWTSSGVPSGYGTISLGSREAGKDYAHRVSWILNRGTIPEGFSVLHRCDNPPCCNPDHLFLGTHQDNMADAKQKGRHRSPLKENPELAATGEHSNSKLTSAQVEALRKRYALGGITQKALGIEYGIKQTHVSRIIHGHRWAKDAGVEHAKAALIRQIGDAAALMSVKQLEALLTHARTLLTEES